jgi:hypothetical protein
MVFSLAAHDAAWIACTGFAVDGVTSIYITSICVGIPIPAGGRRSWALLGRALVLIERTALTVVFRAVTTAVGCRVAATALVCHDRYSTMVKTIELGVCCTTYGAPPVKAQFTGQLNPNAVSIACNNVPCGL